MLHCHVQAALLPGKNTGNHCIRGCVEPRPVWTSVEKGKFLARTGVPTPNSSAHNESPMKAEYTARTGPVTLRGMS
jgi:hypothetical protein